MIRLRKRVGGGGGGGGGTLCPANAPFGSVKGVRSFNSEVQQLAPVSGRMTVPECAVIHRSCDVMSTACECVSVRERVKHSVWCENY